MGVPKVSCVVVAALFSLSASACGSSSSAGPEACPDSGPPPADAAPPTDQCFFTPNAPQWVVEGELLTVQISCGSGSPLSDLALGALPAGAAFDTATNTLSWTPGLDQAAVYDLSLASQDLYAEGTLRIGVADALQDPNNVPIVDPSKYTMELGLPVIFIAQEPSSDSNFEPMQVTYGGVVHEAEAKLRGKSSLTYPKKSYALRFDKFDAFNEGEFADFRNRTRVILTSTFDDNSYFRQRLAYTLWSQLNPTISITAYNAVVYRGTEYRGIYTISDHVNAELMARNGLSDDANLYKAENHDANFRTTANNGSNKGTLHQGYSKTEGDSGVFDDMDDLVSFVANSDDATFNAGIGDLVSVDDYAAWWIQVTFILGGDSAGKNSYHYHDLVRTWRVIPWDFNYSFGQDWQTLRTDSNDGTTYVSRNRLFERLLAHPTFGPQIHQRYKDTLESGAYSKANLMALVDGYTDELKLAADRDWARWQDEYYAFGRWSGRRDFTDNVEEVAYVRNWLLERWQFAFDTY